LRSGFYDGKFVFAGKDAVAEREVGEPGNEIRENPNARPNY